MLHGYSRQRRTIGCFSATAGLLVKCCYQRVTAVQKRQPESRELDNAVNLCADFGRFSGIGGE